MSSRSKNFAERLDTSLCKRLRRRSSAANKRYMKYCCLCPQIIRADTAERWKQEGRKPQNAVALSR